MECQKFSKWIGEYYDHRLAESQRKDLESHLRVCAACRKTLSDWAEITALAKAIPSVKAPEGFEAALREKIQARARARGGWEIAWEWLSRPKLQFAALAVMMVVLIGALLVPRPDSQRPNPEEAQPGSIANKLPESAEMPDYVDVLLKGAGNEQVIMRLPSTLRVYSADPDDAYFQNVSH